MSTTTRPTVPRYVNRIMKALLLSPMHPLISKNTMLLTFPGRKSGRRYAVIVRYVGGEGPIEVFTDSKWWINLREPTPVEMRIRGKTQTGIAAAVTDPITVADRLVQFLREMPGDSKYYGVVRDAAGMPQPADVVTAAGFTTLIEISATP